MIRLQRGEPCFKDNKYHRICSSHYLYNKVWIAKTEQDSDPSLNCINMFLQFSYPCIQQNAICLSVRTRLLLFSTYLLGKINKIKYQHRIRDKEQFIYYVSIVSQTKLIKKHERALFSIYLHYESKIDNLTKSSKRQFFFIETCLFEGQ